MSNRQPRLCRFVLLHSPCHSAVHRSHDNETLGQSFYTVERLLADEKASDRWRGQAGRIKSTFPSPFFHLLLIHLSFCHSLQVARFVAWARKVRPSLRSHTEQLRYRR